MMKQKIRICELVSLSINSLETFRCWEFVLLVQKSVWNWNIQFLPWTFWNTEALVVRWCGVPECIFPEVLGSFAGRIISINGLWRIDIQVCYYWVQNECWDWPTLSQGPQGACCFARPWSLLLLCKMQRRKKCCKFLLSWMFSHFFSLRGDH